MVVQSAPITRREMLALTGATALAGCSGVNQLVPQSSDDSVGQSPLSNVVSQQTHSVRAFVGSYHWGYFVLDEDGSELDQLTLSPGEELRLTLFNVEADAAIAKLPQAVRNNIPSSEERARRNEQAIPVPQGTTLDSLHDAAEAAYPDHSLALVSDEFMWSRPGGPGRGPGSGAPSGPWGGHHGPHGGVYGPWGGQGPGRDSEGQYGPGPMPGAGPGMMPGAGPGMMPGSGPGMRPGYGPGMTPGYGPGSMPGYGPGMMPGYGWGSGADGTLAPPVYLWHHSTVPSELGFVANTTGSFGFVCTVYCGYGHPYMAERSRVVVTGE